MTWEVGDLAVCVDDAERWSSCPINLAKIKAGVTYRVQSVVCSGMGLLLEGVGSSNPSGYWHDRFRKILPDKAEQCEPEFVTLLKRIKVPETASSWLERAGPIAKRLNLESKSDTRQTLKEGDK